jgi:hypothetical protein
LQYKEEDVTNEIKNKGYLDKDGGFQGVGIKVFANGQ